MARALRLALRIAFAAGVTGYLLWKSHPALVLDAAAGARWTPIMAAIALVLADRSLMAYRSVALLCTVDPALRPSLGALMRVFFVSTFAGTFLPASIGGDLIRSYSMARLNVPAGDAVASVFMDRMLGVASVLLTALAGLLFARSLATNAAVVVGLLATSVVCAVTLAAIFSERAAAALTAVASRMPIPAVRRGAASVILSVRKYEGHPGPLLNVLACSIGVQLLRVTQAWLLGMAIGIALPFTLYVAFVPLILLVMLLPITINGLGTSQAAFVWFFGRAGVAAAPAFALSILFVALGIVGNLPGAALYLAGPPQDQVTR